MKNIKVILSIVIAGFIATNSLSQNQAGTLLSTRMTPSNFASQKPVKSDENRSKKKPNTPSPKVIKQALDSVFTLTDYDGDGQFNQSSTAISYDLSGNAILFISYIWDVTQWLNEGKSQFSYDNSNNNVAYISYSWDGNQWINNSKSEFTIDVNGNTTLETYFSWDGSQWLNSSKYEHFYDISGNETSQIAYTWNGSLWVNVSKWEYSYDISDNLLLEIAFNWNGNQWVNQGKWENSFDNNNNFILNIYYTWDGNQWAVNSKREYTYDANGNKTLGIVYNWNGSLWLNSYKQEFTYDTNGNGTLSLNYSWDGNQWISSSNSSKFESTYNLNYSRNDLIFPFFFDFIGNNQPIEEKYFDYSNGIFVLNKKENYFYSEQNFNLSSVYTLEKESIQFYPNPSKDKLTISTAGAMLKQLTITDLNGEILSIHNYSGNSAEISVDQLNVGVYLLQIATENGTVVKRFVKD